MTKLCMVCMGGAAGARDPFVFLLLLFFPIAPRRALVQLVLRPIHSTSLPTCTTCGAPHTTVLVQA